VYFWGKSPYYSLNRRLGAPGQVWNF